MASCAHCGSLLILRKRVGDQAFCNDACVQNARLALAAGRVPQTQVDEYAARLFQGPCGKCGGPGPIDVFTSHWVWSIGFLTSSKSVPVVSCRRCGMKAQALGLVSSLIVGWWGFPWGLILTPVQAVRNVVGLCRGASVTGPSVALQEVARVKLATSSGVVPRSSGTAA